MYAKRLGVATILAVVIFGAVYGAAAALDISGVNKLGSGSANVESPPDVTGVNFLLDPGDYTKVDKVVIYLESSLTNGHAYVELTDSGGTVISRSSETYFSGTEVTVDVPDVPAADVCDIHITIIGDSAGF